MAANSAMAAGNAEEGREAARDNGRIILPAVGALPPEQGAKR